MNEVMAIAEVQAGNAAAYQVLVERYQTPVARYLERLLGNRTLAEDVAQDAFIEAFYAISKNRYGHLAKSSSNLSPATIFYYYATQRAFSHTRPSLPARILPFLRKSHVDRRHAQAKEHEQTLFAPPPGATRVAFLEPEQTSAERAEQERLQAALLQLPREQAACLLLHSMIGFSYAEVATITRRSLAQVRAQIGRGRQALLPA